MHTAAHPSTLSKRTYMDQSVRSDYSVFRNYGRASTASSTRYPCPSLAVPFSASQLSKPTGTYTFPPVRFPFYATRDITDDAPIGRTPLSGQHIPVIGPASWTAVENYQDPPPGDTSVVFGERKA